MNVKFSNDAIAALDFSRDEALRTGHLGIGPEHIALGLLRQGKNAAVEILCGAGADPEEMKRAIDAAVFREEALSYSELDNIRMSKAGQSVLGMAHFETIKRGSTVIECSHLLLALCLSGTNTVTEYLGSKGISHDSVAEAILKMRRARGEVSVNAPAVRDLSGAIAEQLGRLLNPQDGSSAIYS